MSQDSGSNLIPLHGKDDKAFPAETTANKDKPPLLEIAAPKKKPSHLTLVVSNPAPVQDAPASHQPAFSNTGFTVNVKEMLSDLYEMNIQDSFHDLECTLTLEIEGDNSEKTVVCHFPTILNQPNKFLEEDEDLYGSIAIQFQINVLEHLFLFCANHEASQLIIHMDDGQAEGFGIYQEFLLHCHGTLTENNKKAKMVIPTDRDAFEKWRSFMAGANLKLEQGLWREQRFNTAIRRYLKSRSIAKPMEPEKY
jgi:hypothetical protein